MKREQLAAQGAPPSDRLRIELTPLPDVEPLRLEQLHDDAVGTFARVFRGRLGQGQFWVPVAVKLQRDVALSREQSGRVAAKFALERSLHDRLQRGREPADLDRLPIARLHALESDEGDELPPSVLCRQARHALEPRCPACGGLLRPDEWVQGDDERRLECDGCHSRYAVSADTRARIVAASVQRSAACAGCPHRSRSPGERCLRDATLLNFFASRVLVFELLDLDLHDYLAWRQRTEGPPGRARAWQAFQAHRQARGPEDGPAWLRELLSLFERIFEGAEFLHRQGVSHLDLKPNNVCLRFDGGRAQAKVIDLGLADDPEALTYLRQAQGSRQLQNEYTAPETRQEGPTGLPVYHLLQGNRLQLQLAAPSATDSQDAFVVPGDRVLLRLSDGRGIEGVVRGVIAEANHLRLEAEATGPAGVPSSSQGQAELAIDKVAGPAADLYSLGMLLLALLTRRVDLRAYQAEVPSLFNSLRDQAAELGPASNRQLVRALRVRNTARFVPNFLALANALAEYGPLRFLAEELLGVVIRCTVRGTGPLFWLAHRGCDGGPALQRLSTELGRIRRAAQLIEGEQSSETHRKELQGRVGAWRRWLEARPPGNGSAKATSRPAFDRQELLQSLALIDPAFPPEDREATELYRRYGGNVAWLLEHLTLLQQEGEGRGKVIEVFPDTGLLVNLLAYSHPFDFDQAACRRFLEAWPGHRQAEQQGAAGLPSVFRQRFQVLHELLARFDTLTADLDLFLTRLERLFFEPLGVERAVGGREALRFVVGRRLRELVPDGQVRGWLDELQAAQQQAESLFQTRLKHLSRMLDEWAAAQGPLRAALVSRERYARWQREELKQRYARWQRDYQETLRRLHDFLDGLETGMLQRWDAALAARPLLDRLRRRQAPTVRLEVTVREQQLVEMARPRQALETLRTLGLGPGSTVEATLALGQLEVLRQQAGQREPSEPGERGS